MINPYLESVGSALLTGGVKLIDLLARPNIGFTSIAVHLPELAERLGMVEAGRRDEIIESAEILIKYAGYIERERQQADKLRRLEYVPLPADFDYNAVSALSTEARQTLSRIAPATVGQASRIPGVSPADINILLILLNR